MIRWQHQQKQHGQVVTFFALSFSFFLVLLMMLINTGILTRDRIKLQNSADLAALVGANVQRINLNEVGKINDSIETAYIATQAALSNPFTSSPCTYNGATCNSTAGACNLVCRSQDNIARALIIEGYLAHHSYAASQIGAIVSGANAIAYDLAKRTALAGPNLPVDIRRAIRKRYGGNFPSATDMVRQYDRSGLQFDYSGTGDVSPLNAIYTVAANDSQPLFEADVDQGVLIGYIGIYNPCASGPLVVLDASPCFIGNWAPILPIPVPKTIEDKGSITPAFMVSLAYSPQFNFNLFKAPIRRLASSRGPFKAGEVVVNTTGKEAQLFDLLLGTQPFGSSLFNRQFMTAWSASRAYGGSPSRGSYEGAKLIGLASKSIGEVVHDWNIGFDMVSPETGASHTFTERDFLH